MIRNFDSSKPLTTEALRSFVKMHEYRLHTKLDRLKADQRDMYRESASHLRKF